MEAGFFLFFFFFLGGMSKGGEGWSRLRRKEEEVVVVVAFVDFAGMGYLCRECGFLWLDGGEGSLFLVRSICI